MIHPPHKDRADPSLRQARRIDSHTDSAPSPFLRGAQPAHRLVYGAIDALAVQTLQATVQHREFGPTGKPQRPAQFALFAQTHLGFPKGSVLVAHPTEGGQQLWLRGVVFAETASVARKYRL